MVTSSRATLLLLVVLPAVAWSREAASPSECQQAASEPAIVMAKTAVGAEPEDLRARFRLADAWSDVGCFGDAVRVLQAGVEAHPHHKELQERLRVAKSLVSEQTYFEKVDQAAEDARFTRARFRCTKLAELSSCDEALDMKPDDPTLVVSEADALMQLKRPGEAISVYRNALHGMPDPAPVTAKIVTAEAQRQMLLETCEMQTGEAARRACESAWLPGAPDEARLFVRRGLLLQSDNQLAPALDAYMVAARLLPDDRAIAQSVVTLCDSTRRMDAVTLTAKGAALNTLGRSSEALDPLRQALRQAPDLAAARSQLRIAERPAPAGATRRTLGEASRPATDAVRSAKAETPATPSIFSNDAPATRTN